MWRYMAQVVIALACATASSAQTFRAVPDDEEGGAPRPAREEGIDTGLALEAARVANGVCHALGFTTTALIVDSAGVPIVMISENGAAQLTQRLASGKAVTAVRLKMSSGEARKASSSDPDLRSRLEADPEMGPPRAGGFPIMVDGKALGAIAVSGAPTGVEEEPCARAGLAVITERLGATAKEKTALGAFDPASILVTDPAAARFEGRPGETRARLYGDPAKPGPYAILYKWEPGHNSRPHFHKVDRLGYVISGTWWMSNSPSEDRGTLRPVPAGSFVVHKAGKVHWDGAVDMTALVLVTGMGPIETVWLDPGAKP